MKFLLLLLGKLLELLRAERLALAHRDEGDAGRRLDDADILPLGFFFDFLEGLFLGFLEFLGDRLALGLEVLALECRRNGCLGVCDDLLDIDAQFLAAAGRKRQGPWLAGIIEVVDVAPVQRHRERWPPFFSRNCLHKQVAPGARRTEHVDVVPIHVDFGRELNGLPRPVLARNFGSDPRVRPWSGSPGWPGHSA